MRAILWILPINSAYNFRRLENSYYARLRQVFNAAIRLSYPTYYGEYAPFVPPEMTRMRQRHHGSSELSPAFQIRASGNSVYWHGWAPWVGAESARHAHSEHHGIWCTRVALLWRELAYCNSDSVQENLGVHINKRRNRLKVSKQPQDIPECRMSWKRGPERSSAPCSTS